jgi:hypothetical protein
MASAAGDTFPAAVATLRSAGAPASALCDACHLLLRLLGGDEVCDPVTQRAAVDAGVLEAVVATLRGEHAAADDVRCLAAGVLHAVMLKQEAAAARAVRAGAVGPLLIALLNASAAAATQCLYALTDLAVDSSGAAAMVRCGAPARVAAVMRLQLDDLDVQDAGAIVLHNLVSDKHGDGTLWPAAEHARAVLAPHFATPLSAALARFPREEPLQRQSFAALWGAYARLCARDGGEAHNAYVGAAVAAGLRGAVAAGLRGSAARASGDVAQAVCLAQAWLCPVGSTPAQQRACSECVAPLVALLTCHAAHAGAAEAALRALAAITVDEPQTRAAAAAAGAAGAAGAVLAAQPRNATLACWALQLLSIAATDPSGRAMTARDGAGVAACVAALRTHPRDNVVKQAAFLALSNLTNTCPPNKAAAHEQGIIPLVLCRAGG